MENYLNKSDEIESNKRKRIMKLLLCEERKVINEVATKLYEKAVCGEFEFGSTDYRRDLTELSLFKVKAIEKLYSFSGISYDESISTISCSFVMDDPMIKRYKIR